jgi:hypothetical protein
MYLHRRFCLGNQVTRPQVHACNVFDSIHSGFWRSPFSRLGFWGPHSKSPIRVKRPKLHLATGNASKLLIRIRLTVNFDVNGRVPRSQMMIVSRPERRTLTMNASFIDKYVLESRHCPPKPFGFDCLREKCYRQ